MGELLYLDGHRPADDRHIDTSRYVARWHRTPAGRTEIWSVMSVRQLGSLYWFRGTYDALANYLAKRDNRRGAWKLDAPSQAIFDNPHGRIVELGRDEAR